jgi:5-methylcytosine-specific restriction endonuclease McrA
VAFQYSVARNQHGKIQARDEIGKIYGRLTVVRQAPKRIKKSGQSDPHAYWICQCSCGNSAIVSGSSLRTGNSTSCGCRRREAFKPKTLPPGEAAANRAISVMMKNAANRGIDWLLTMESVRSIMAMNCHYCANPPSNISKASRINGNFTYSGIDRVNSSVGYIESNVVPCCFKCNNAKSDIGVEEFKEWARQLYENFGRKP